MLGNETGERSLVELALETLRRALDPEQQGPGREPLVAAIYVLDLMQEQADAERQADTEQGLDLSHLGDADR